MATDAEEAALGDGLKVITRSCSAVTVRGIPDNSPQVVSPVEKQYLNEGQMGAGILCFNKQDGISN